MAQSHSPAPIDPDSVKHAEATWRNFMTVTKWFVIHMIAVLVLMAIFLV